MKCKNKLRTQLRNQYVENNKEYILRQSDVIMYENKDFENTWRAVKTKIYLSIKFVKKKSGTNLIGLICLIKETSNLILNLKK